MDVTEKRGSHGMEAAEEQSPEACISKAQAQKGSPSMEERGLSPSSTMGAE